MKGSAVIGLLQDEADMRTSHERSSEHYGVYATEILEHAGLTFTVLSRDDLSRGNLPPLVVLPYRLRLTAEESASMRRHAEEGGTVLAVGGVEGADDLFGVKTSRRHLNDGALHWPEGGLGLEPLGAPTWGGQLASVAEDADGIEVVLGELNAGDESTGPALVLRKVGRGVVCFLAVDVPRSVVTLQQGVPVLGDASSAPDGSAELEDSILKADDGAVIPWEFREQGPEGPAFLTPYGDLLRELMITALLECAQRTGTLLPMRWNWPNALPAVATLSYDTDSNEDPDGRKFLGVVRDLGVHGTWCVMYPGGYERGTYDAIRDYGDEIALHFDGLTTDLNGAPNCTWSRADFDHQHTWLMSETGAGKVISQKNHVTRWEGWVEFFRWVEASGIRVDQSKGPSKIGNLGFNFGTCQIWRPMEDALHGNRLLDVFELTFHTHDMHHSERRVALRREVLRAAKRVAGVAHFIFHPQRIHEQGQPEAIADIVAYGRELGVEWWTSERIWRWHTARRLADVGVERDGDDLVITVADAPEGLTLLLFGLDNGLTHDGQALETVHVHGRSAHRIVTPSGATEVRLSRRRS